MGRHARGGTCGAARAGGTVSICSPSTASISGEGVYGALKEESGVHRVQRVPTTESLGRVHTSTAVVIVLPEADETGMAMALAYGAEVTARQEQGLLAIHLAAVLGFDQFVRRLAGSLVLVLTATHHRMLPPPPPPP